MIRVTWKPFRAQTCFLFPPSPSTRDDALPHVEGFVLQDCLDLILPPPFELVLLFACKSGRNNNSVALTLSHALTISNPTTTANVVINMADELPNIPPMHAGHAKTMGSPKYKKAPDAPKRFKSAFIIFSAEKHKEIKAKLAEQGRVEKVCCRSVRLAD